MCETCVLLCLAALLGVAAWRLHAMLRRLRTPLARVVGIVMGGLGGIAVGLPVAVLLNPLVGLQRGTFENLAILSICLGFLGFCVGSLSGLLYSGMILSAASRIEQVSDESAKPVDGGPLPPGA